MKSKKKTSGIQFYGLAFGLFLGLCIWKFGNPVILDSKIIPPVSFSDFWNDSWPTRWANWILLPFVLVGGVLAMVNEMCWPATRWLWLLPMLWFGWQLFSATQTVDDELTTMTLWQFFGCIAAYFLGALVLGNEHALRWLLIGVLAAFAFCLVRAVDQRLIEFPQSHQMLMEGEQTGWTNYPAEMLRQMKQENVVLTTNGVAVANPVILAKFAKGRVNGTLVYPNALAGLVLLLFPISLTLAFNNTRKLRPIIRAALIGLVLFLGIAGFFWTGSKLGWLIVILIGGLCLLRLDWPTRWKWAAVTTVLIIGLGIFAVRFHDYFTTGATSAGARFDYWHAAVQTTMAKPLLGTGPGTFQRPYTRLKLPKSEMARLTHNDYLEQFSDSGILGGVFYASWILLALVILGRRIWTNSNLTSFAIFIGLLGWFIQGIGEFSLYIPALAWAAFTLLGCLLGLSGNRIDKPLSAN